MSDVPCRTCAATLPAGFRFCPSCGTQVEPDSGLVAGEVRKTVTLLFCDVSGSTALGEQLDPEVLRALMGEYFAVARSAVEQHGGTVEKFVGDAVLAVFGIPVAREDDAMRAVRAAAQMRDALLTLSQDVERRHGVQLAVRTGVNTGEVVAGVARAGGSFATGDAVNTTARLEQAAAPGEILLGATTHRLVRDAVVAQPRPPLVAKGKAAPLEVFRLVKVLEVEHGRTRRTDARLVGRDRERRALDDALARVVADRRCQMVTLLGPAGMGKTRLVAEFESALSPGTRVLRGRCLSYGRGITFWPILSVLRQAAGATATAPAKDVADGLHQVLGGLPESAAVVERLAPLLGTGEPGGTEETFWAMRLLLEHLADAAPVVLVVDDVQWAEPALLDLLEYLRDETRDVPLLVICPARPELLEQRPTWGGGALNATTLSLEPLTGDSTQQLLDDLLGGAVPSAVTAVVNRWGEGNPLFLEEVSTHLLEEGLLVDIGSGWTLTDDLSRVPIPPTLTALLTARLDRLPAAERSLLEQVSVIGLEVRYDEAAMLTGDPDNAASLASLTRKGVLRRVRGGSGEAFAFRHVLVREAAYDALPKAQRAALHERYADRLSEHTADIGGEVDAFVGFHLEQATRLRQELSPGSPKVTALACRAADALAAAAERARHADDLTAAEQFYARSLALTSPTDPARRRRLLHLAWVRGASWRTADARSAVEEALALAIPTAGAPDVVQLALLAEQAAIELAGGGLVDPATARERGIAAADAARALGDTAILNHAVMVRINADLVLARYDAMEAGAQQLMTSALAAEQREGRHTMLAAGMLGSKPYAEVLAFLHSVDDVIQTPSMRAHLLAGRAVTLAALGRADEAQRDLEAAYEPLAMFEGTAQGPFAFTSREVLLFNGQVDAAVQEMRKGIESFRRTGGLSFASTLLGQLAIELAQTGDDEGARVAIAEAESVTAPYDVVSVVLVLAVKALLAVREDRCDEALALRDAALSQADATDALMLRGELYRALSEVPAHCGNPAEQRQMLAEALRLFAAKGNIPFTRRGERELAELD